MVIPGKRPTAFIRVIGLLLALLGACAMTLAPAASASSNNAPSKAARVKLGVPFTGNWTGTVLAHGDDNFNHGWRLPAVRRPGDIAQIALDNRLGDDSLHLCLAPPLDDFAADDTLDNCSYDTYVQGLAQDRVRITYDSASGQGFLIVIDSSCCPYLGDTAPADSGQYTATIERIITLVNLGLSVPSTLPSDF